MNAPIRTYLNANGPYWFSIQPNLPPEITALVDEGPHAIRLVRIDPKALSNGLTQVPASQLPISDLATTKGAQFDVYVEPHLIVVSEHKRAGFFGGGESFLSAIGNAACERFRNWTKKHLIEALSKVSSGTGDVLGAFRNYTFFDSYSAWLYNDITDTFTRIAGDLPARIDYVKSNQSAVLKDVLSRNTLYKCAVSQHYDVPDTPSPLNWCNAFSVEAARTPGKQASIKAIICLYSKYRDYNLREATLQLMRSFVQQNLADRYSDRLLRLASIHEHLPKESVLDTSSAFLASLAQGVCNDLRWESCTIFLENKETSSLDPVGCFPQREAATQDSYPLSATKSLTLEVFRTKKMKWSYDIEKDPQNSHTIDDITQTPPKDWIGVPISGADNTAIGVLRVKNILVASDQDDPHFTSLDMHVLQLLAGEIAGILHQSDILAERKNLADQRTRELSELEDFLRTFRHEIRSPIQAVCFAPERLALILRDEGLIGSSDVPKKLREYLADFKASGNRLEMISKALTLNPEDIVKDMAVNNLYKRCIAPVLAFAVPYANKKKRRVEVDKDSLLVNITCDDVAMSMAFHVLIDNAVKYSDVDETIRVYGKPIAGGGHQVVVESKSKLFRIPAEEAEHLFEKYYRGRAAKGQKLEGSGIGLYLADRIMALHRGKLALLSLSDPVAFALQLRD